MDFLPQNWIDIFRFKANLIELIIRGMLLYTSLVLLMRINLRRSSSHIATMDIVFLLLLTNAASQGLGTYSSLPDTIVVVMTLMTCDYLLNYLSYQFPLLEKIVSPPALQIIRDGKLLRRNMRREFLTKTELMNNIREQGYEDLSQIESAFIENDGSITLRKKKAHSKL